MCLENSEIIELEEELIMLQGPQEFKLFEPCRREQHWNCAKKLEEAECICLCHTEFLETEEGPEYA